MVLGFLYKAPRADMKNLLGCESYLRALAIQYISLFITYHGSEGRICAKQMHGDAAMTPVRDPFCPCPKAHATRYNTLAMQCWNNALRFDCADTNLRVSIAATFATHKVLAMSTLPVDMRVRAIPLHLCAGLFVQVLEHSAQTETRRSSRICSNFQQTIKLAIQ